MKLSSRAGAHMLASVKPRRRDDREAVNAQAAGDPGVVARAVGAPVEDHPGMAVRREHPAELRVDLVLVTGHDHEPALRPATPGLPGGKPRRARSTRDNPSCPHAIQGYQRFCPSRRDSHELRALSGEPLTDPAPASSGGGKP